MGDLRAQMIRLAHERPDLRPHLLPMLKEGAWTPLPRDETDFGYEGHDAHRVGVHVAQVIRKAFNDTRAQAEVLWKQVAVALIEAAPVDEQPILSRVVASMAFEDNYRDLMEKVDAYFPRVPAPEK